MRNHIEIEEDIAAIIPEALQKKYIHLSYAEMAEINELAPYRYELLQAEDDWFNQ